MNHTIQIRDVDDHTYTVLRTRAAAAHLSLTAYLRRQLDQWADTSTMAELLDRADQRRKRGMQVAGSDVVAAIRAVRDEDE
jgi:plasmid stability protein